MKGRVTFVERCVFRTMRALSAGTWKILNHFMQCRDMNRAAKWSIWGSAITKQVMPPGYEASGKLLNWVQAFFSVNHLLTQGALRPFTSRCHLPITSMVLTSSDEVSDKLKVCMTHRLIAFLGWNVSLKVPLYTWIRTILTQQNLPLQSQSTNLTCPQQIWFLCLYHIASFQLPKPEKEIPSFLVTSRRCFPVSSQKFHAKPDPLQRRHGRQTLLVDAEKTERGFGVKCANWQIWWNPCMLFIYLIAFAKKTNHARVQVHYTFLSIGSLWEYQIRWLLCMFPASLLQSWPT